MNEDFSDVFNKFSEILKEKDIDLNHKVGGGNPPPTKSNDSNDSDFSLDIETIMKIKNIITALNQNKDCPRNKVLLSLKPYLENEKKEKLDQYIKIANLLTVLENFDGNHTIKFSESNYDFILIITLFLLLF